MVCVCLYKPQAYQEISQRALEGFHCTLLRNSGNLRYYSSEILIAKCYRYILNNVKWMEYVSPVSLDNCLAINIIHAHPLEKLLYLVHLQFGAKHPINIFRFNLHLAGGKLGDYQLPVCIPDFHAVNLASHVSKRGCQYVDCNSECVQVRSCCLKENIL